MSHSVPSDSSAIDAAFLVGVDLVEFDRRDLPIYASPQTRWMDACTDSAPSYGASLDRVFGEPGDVHIDGTPGTDVPLATVAADDPLVALSTLADGLAVTGAGPAAPELATSFDFGTTDAHAVIHLHDSTGWDITGADGTFDYLA
jgi:hypothetical protein